MTSYRSWEDLLDEEGAGTAPAVAGTPTLTPLHVPTPGSGPAAAPPESPPPASPTRQAPAPSERGAGLRRQLLESVGGDAGIPEDVLALVDEYERAERKLRQLTGQASSEPADAREAARFPLKHHTAASRLEERRLATLDERSSAARKRLQEGRLVEARAERDRVEAAGIRRARERRRLVHARSEEERARTRRGAEAARAAVHARDLARWEEDRRRALQRSSLARRELAAHAEHRLERVRADRIDARRAALREEARDEARRARALARRADATSRV